MNMFSAQNGYLFRQLARPSYWLWLCFAQLFSALYLFAAIQTYLENLPMLLSLENKRGATELVLKPVGASLLYVMGLWSVFCGGRFFAFQRQTRSYYLSLTEIGATRYPHLIHAMGLLFCSLLAGLVCYWLCIALLSPYTQWDKHHLLAIALTHLLHALYTTLLTTLVSLSQKHSTTASLMLALIWASLWFLPALSSEPAWLGALLQWFSPYAHSNLLLDGILSVQTMLFYGLHFLAFFTLIIYLQENIYAN